MKPAVKLQDAYGQLAVIVLNSILLLVALNLSLWVYFSFHDFKSISPITKSDLSPNGLFYEAGGAVDNGKRTPSNLSIFDYKAYEGVMSEQEIGQLLDEIYDHGQLGFEYQAYSQYGHREFAGDYINVEIKANGLAVRKTINPKPTNPEWPTLQVFAFGGSTTYGKGVADGDTWPSYLSQILNERARQSGIRFNVEVTNHGRVGFYPTQEVHHFMEVLRSGERPDIAIFLDGLNFGRDDDTPSLTTEYIRTIHAAQFSGLKDRLGWIPMVRASNALRLRFAEPVERPGQQPEHVVERFLQARQNATAIAAQYGVLPYFFLQPDAHYNYPEHLFGPGKLPIKQQARAFKEQVYSAFPANSGYVDLTGLFAAWGDRKAIVDTGHYSPNFSRFVAQHIAGSIDLRGITPGTDDPATPTGVPRQR
ncbi:MAG: SGNH/GDSL hydrolase family protein [Acidiferrobacterales bacterium]|nr:SGNH/GDSL hydrolase family protein [Acidiferrobacterales bacterium]